MKAGADALGTRWERGHPALVEGWKPSFPGGEGRGARVLQIEADNRIGGTLFWSPGQMSAAGTRLQEAEGIEDSPDDHYEDAMRISHGAINPALGRLATDNAAETFDWLMDIGFEPLPGHPVAGKVSGGGKFLAGVAGFREDPDDPLSGTAYRLNPALRMPWEIYVNGEGKRFVREDHPSIDHIERSVLALPELTLYVIFDEPMRQNAPVLNLETREELAARFGNHPYFLKADSLAELARQLNMEAETLEQTVTNFNQAGETRHDPEYGREYMIRPIGKPPFYAAKSVGFSVVSPAGIDVDAGLRVLNEDGTPIPNLYAGGEVIGFSKVSGNAFVGGMSLMPALTFGRLLGKKILNW